MALLRRPIKTLWSLFRLITKRGARFHIYMKSGNIIKIDSYELEYTVSCGKIHELKWDKSNTLNRILITIDVDQIESIVQSSW